MRDLVVVGGDDQFVRLDRGDAILDGRLLIGVQQANLRKPLQHFEGTIVVVLFTQACDNVVHHTGDVRVGGHDALFQRVSDFEGQFAGGTLANIGYENLGADILVIIREKRPSWSRFKVADAFYGFL